MATYSGGGGGSSSGGDIKWFLGLIGIFFLLWIGGGGIGSKNTEKPFIRPITEGGGTYGEDPFKKPSASGQTIKPPSSKDITADLEQAKKDAEEIQREIEDFKKYSPIRNQLTLNRYRNVSGRDPNTEQLVIYAAYSNKNSVTLSGLKLKSVASGTVVTIGNGSTVIMPGTSGGYDQIFLSPGSSAYISSGYSPVGSSFRTNLCTGYFEQNNDFSPPLRLECPAIEDEPMPAPPNHLSDGCLDYIENIGQCRIPESIPAYLDASCGNWIVREVNYNRCVARHRSDEKFFGSEWRIYLNRSEPIWKERREQIQLLDSSGKIISEISY